jgi:hypothetical protein
LYGTKISHALAYVIRHGGSKYLEFDFKRRIQDMAQIWCHNRLMIVCLNLSFHFVIMEM